MEKKKENKNRLRKKQRRIKDKGRKMIETD